MKNPKIYATINRSGTTVRVKDSYQNLMAFINDREAYMATQPPADPDIEPVHFVEKDVWQRIAGELKIGFKEVFTKISFARSNNAFVIARKDMKREVMEAIDLAGEAKKQREEKQQKFKEAAEAEKAAQEKRQAEIKEVLDGLPEEVFAMVNGEGPQKAIEVHGHLLNEEQTALLKKMAEVKYPKKTMTT